MELARNGSKLGSEPAQYTRQPISRSFVASVIATVAPGWARSTASVRIWTPVRLLIPAATSSSTAWRRDSSTTLTPRSASPSANAAPTPSEAPASRAHGPYLAANVTVISLPVTDRGHPHRGEPATGNTPSVIGPDDLIVVETDRIDARPVVADQDNRVDIRAGRCLVRVDGDHLVAHPVHRVPRHRMGPLHEFGDGVDASPVADLAVVEFTVVGENSAEQRPVALVDPGGVAHEQIGDVLAVFSVVHDVSPLGWTTIRGGPSDLRARSSALGTSSRVMIL